jgi:hypothetical protein
LKEVGGGEGGRGEGEGGGGEGGGRLGAKGLAFHKIKTLFKKKKTHTHKHKTAMDEMYLTHAMHFLYFPVKLLFHPLTVP